MKKHAQRIVQGGIDFFRAKENRSDIQFEQCGGSPRTSFDVEAIPDGTRVTWIRGDVRQNAVIREPLGTFECNYNAFTTGAALARRLRLVNGARYLLVYNSGTKTIRIRRKPTSTENIRVIPDNTLNADLIGIGNGLKERLGYFLPERTAISVRGGGAGKRLRVRTLEPGADELFNYEIRLNPRNFGLFGLGNSAGNFIVSYNQVSRVLRFVRRTALRKKAKNATKARKEP
ncbi:hypothetical protein [Paenibacillus hamazuiensis]|uniref:hypothetical protein n=1 Tax=Paenibacillus hamazuiensis TaxID=2936508 RepID=UPI00200D705B|nr:hypothetical protein [Paenibacillus hamazuiensis]